MTARGAREWHSLTPVGKRRRVRPLVVAALEQYGLEVVDVRLHSSETNLLYRVRATSGVRLILRLSYSGWRTLDDLRAQVAWLQALDRDTDIGAPKVIRAKSGESILPMRGAGVPETWHAMLMTWVDGRLLAHYLTRANLAEMGRLFAKLHLHGKSWQPPGDFTARRFEAFLSRGEPDVLFSEAVLGTFEPSERESFLRARGWVESEYAGLDRDDIRVIHCDLWHENIKVDRGRLRPFDFEDTVWGYRLHDLAMGLLDLLETVGAERYKELLAAFRQGYEGLLEWPEGRLEVLQIGRLLWKANWVARFQQAHLRQMAEDYDHVFRRFETSGELWLGGLGSSD